uniref:Uncharacterized protein n=1 Tax=Setaria digitata TaxID=48799 RepID=A0A915Q7Y2_9BILA
MGMKHTDNHFSRPLLLPRKRRYLAEVISGSEGRGRNRSDARTWLLMIRQRTGVRYGCCDRRHRELFVRSSSRKDNLICGKCYTTVESESRMEAVTCCCHCIEANVQEEVKAGLLPSSLLTEEPESLHLTSLLTQSFYIPDDDVESPSASGLFFDLFLTLHTVDQVEAVKLSVDTELTQPFPTKLPLMSNKKTADGWIQRKKDPKCPWFTNPCQ